jgi:hypothetical protein
MEVAPTITTSKISPPTEKKKGVCGEIHETKMISSLSKW